MTTLPYSQTGTGLGMNNTLAGTNVQTTAQPQQFMSNNICLSKLVVSSAMEKLKNLANGDFNIESLFTWPPLYLRLLTIITSGRDLASSNVLQCINPVISELSQLTAIDIRDKLTVKKILPAGRGQENVHRGNTVVHTLERTYIDDHTEASVIIPGELSKLQEQAFKNIQSLNSVIGKGLSNVTEAKKQVRGLARQIYDVLLEHTADECAIAEESLQLGVRFTILNAIDNFTIDASTRKVGEKFKTDMQYTQIKRARYEGTSVTDITNELRHDTFIQARVEEDMKDIFLIHKKPNEFPRTVMKLAASIENPESTTCQMQPNDSRNTASVICTTSLGVTVSGKPSAYLFVSENTLRVMKENGMICEGRITDRKPVYTLPTEALEATEDKNVFKVMVLHKQSKNKTPVPKLQNEDAILKKDATAFEVADTLFELTALGRKLFGKIDTPLGGEDPADVSQNIIGYWVISRPTLVMVESGKLFPVEEFVQEECDAAMRPDVINYTRNIVLTVDQGVYSYDTFKPEVWISLIDKNTTSQLNPVKQFQAKDVMAYEPGLCKQPIVFGQKSMFYSVTHPMLHYGTEAEHAMNVNIEMLNKLGNNVSDTVLLRAGMERFVEIVKDRKAKFCVIRNNESSPLGLNAQEDIMSVEYGPNFRWEWDDDQDKLVLKRQSIVHQYMPYNMDMTTREMRGAQLLAYISCDKQISNLNEQLDKLQTFLLGLTGVYYFDNVGGDDELFQPRRSDNRAANIDDVYEISVDNFTSIAKHVVDQLIMAYKSIYQLAEDEWGDMNYLFDGKCSTADNKEKRMRYLRWKVFSCVVLPTVTKKMKAIYNYHTDDEDRVDNAPTGIVLNSELSSDPMDGFLAYDDGLDNKTLKDAVPSFMNKEASDCDNYVNRGTMPCDYVGSCNVADIAAPGRKLNLKLCMIFMGYEKTGPFALSQMALRRTHLPFHIRYTIKQKMYAENAIIVKPSAMVSIMDTGSQRKTSINTNNDISCKLTSNLKCAPNTILGISGVKLTSVVENPKIVQENCNLDKSPRMNIDYYSRSRRGDVSMTIVDINTNEQENDTTFCQYMSKKDIESINTQQKATMANMDIPIEATAPHSMIESENGQKVHDFYDDFVPIYAPAVGAVSAGHRCVIGLPLHKARSVDDDVNPYVQFFFKTQARESDNWWMSNIGGYGTLHFLANMSNLTPNFPFRSCNITSGTSEAVSATRAYFEYLYNLSASSKCASFTPYETSVLTNYVLKQSREHKDMTVQGNSLLNAVTTHQLNPRDFTTKLGFSFPSTQFTCDQLRRQTELRFAGNLLITSQEDGGCLFNKADDVSGNNYYVRSPLNYSKETVMPPAGTTGITSAAFIV